MAADAEKVQIGPYWQRKNTTLNISQSKKNPFKWRQTTFCHLFQQ
jgi:hypothetical protein